MAMTAVLMFFLSFFLLPQALVLVAMIFITAAALWFADAVKEWNDSEENDNPHSRW